MCRTAYENSSVFQVLKMMPKVEDTEQYNNIQIKEDVYLFVRILARRYANFTPTSGINEQ
jgi:hypothetical protein